MIAYEGHQCSELLRDKQRLDALLNLDVDVKPTDDGKWVLIDWREQPPRSREFATGREAIDAAIAATRAPAMWGDEPTAYV